MIKKKETERHSEIMRYVTIPVFQYFVTTNHISVNVYSIKIHYIIKQHKELLEDIFKTSFSILQREF